MRVAIWRTAVWAVLVVLAVFLLSKLLEPITGDVKADILSSGVVIACNLSWVEHYRRRDEIDLDWLLSSARFTYLSVFFISAPTIADLLVQIEPEAPAWLRAIASPVVLLAVAIIAALLTHLLCRVSFSAEEIRAAARRDLD
jgi:hypothetical protein